MSYICKCTDRDLEECPPDSPGFLRNGTKVGKEERRTLPSVFKKKKKKGS